MITGTIVGYGVAQTAGGQRAPFQMITPEKTIENLTTIAKEGRRWQGTAQHYHHLVETQQLPFEVANRADFAENVLALVGENVRQGVCCQIIAQAQDGRLLGVVQYGLKPRTREGTINLQATDPEHIPGAPDGQQLRGIGTSLVAAATQDFLKQNIEVVYLHPLDEAAASFWQGRGFKICGLGGLMCVKGESEIQQLLGRCQLQPDCPDQGECLLCGRPEDTILFRQTVRGVR